MIKYLKLIPMKITPCFVQTSTSSQLVFLFHGNTGLYRELRKKSFIEIPIKDSSAKN